MIRIITFILAFIIMGYSINSWNDDSKQSMLILQLLLVFMLASMGIQNVKKDEKENNKYGAFAITYITFLYYCIVNKIF